MAHDPLLHASDRPPYSLTRSRSYPCSLNRYGHRGEPGLVPRASELLMLPVSGLNEVRHTDYTPIGRGIKSGRQSYVLDVAARELHLARDQSDVHIVGKRGFLRENAFPDLPAIFFIWEGEFDDGLQASYKSRIEILAQIGRQNADPLIFLHLLEEVRNFDVGVPVVGIAHLGTFSKE